MSILSFLYQNHKYYKKISLFNFLVFCLLPLTLQAQNTGHLTGQVTDEEGEPLPGANVVIKDVQRGTATDPDGFYRLEKIPAGEQIIVFSFIGFEREEITVNIRAGETVVRDISLTPTQIESDEMIIQAQRDILRTLEAKRLSTAIIDVIDVETVEKLPLQDMTEALDRLPGVNITGRSAGRGFKNSFVSIRGIQPNLNNTTIMGAPLASTTATRAVALDALPSTLSSQMEVVKAITPDMDANTIGGSVNLVPLTAFQRQSPYLSVAFQGALVDEQGAIKGDEPPLNLDVVGSKRFGDKLGIAAAFNYKQEEFSRTTSQPDDWEPIPQEGFPQDLLVPEGTRLEQSQSSFERYSGALSLEWRPNTTSKLRVVGSHTSTNDEQTSTQTEWNFADNKDEVDFELRSPTEIFSPEGENEKEADFDEQDEQLSFVIGSAEFFINDWTWNIGSSYSRANNREDVNEWSFDSRNFASVIDLSGKLPFARPVDQQAFNDPASFEFDEIDIEPRRRLAESFHVSTDVRYDIDLLGPDGFFKIGGYFRNQDISSDASEFQNSFNEASGFTDITLGGLGLDRTMKGVFGFPISPAIDPVNAPKFIRNNPNFLKQDELSLDDQIEDDFKVEEDVIAGYFMGSATYRNFTFTAGARIEYTETESFFKQLNEAADLINDFTETNNYTKVLPNFHVRYRFNEKLQARVAATYTIARPQLQDLAGAQALDFDNSDILEGTRANPIRVSDADLESGNPDLDPFESTNIDVTLEYFRRRGSFYSMGFIYKGIDDPIFEQSIDQSNVTFNDIQFTELTRELPLNAKGGHLVGFEAQVQETFTFLPKPLDHFGVTANLVYLDSEFEVPGREGEDLPFFLQPDVVLAITPFWEYRGFKMRMSYQFTDEFVTSFGSNAQNDEIEASTAEVDLQFSYDLFSRYTVSLGIENVTNELVGNEFQGRPGRPTNLDNEGSQFWFGIRAQL